MARDMAAMVAAVRRFANENYESGGWDVVVECYSDEDIIRSIGSARSLTGAVRNVGADVGVYDDHRRDIEATAF